MSPRNVVTWMPERSCFRTPSQSQGVHVSQEMLKSERQRFYPTFQSTIDKLSQKTALSVRSEISLLFANRLTADQMYSRNNWENLSQHVQRPLSQKRQTFTWIFIQYLESTQNFLHFQKKDQVHSLNIWEVIESEKCGDFNAQKLLFKNTLLEPMSSGVPKTVEIGTVELLS